MPIGDLRQCLQLARQPPVTRANSQQPSHPRVRSPSEGKTITTYGLSITVASPPTDWM